MNIFSKKSPNKKSKEDMQTTEDLLPHTVLELFRGNLHDNLNIIYFARTRLEALSEKLKRENSTNLDEVEKTIAMLTQADSSMRFLLLNLKVPRLDNKPLKEAIDEHIYLLQNLETSSNFQVTIDQEIDIDRLPHIADAFFNIAKEAMANAIHHGKATLITLSIKSSGDKLNLTIKDNGQGFDLNAVSHGSGIPFIQSLVKSISGKVSIETSLGKGTILEISIPTNAD